MAFQITVFKDGRQIREQADTASEADKIVSELLKKGGRQVYIHDGNASLTHEELTGRANGVTEPQSHTT